ncbi:hypothetical protein, partial [Proteus terrae]|uniref:hypothetical protein n=1 Tax=Proteus terrae TaxID=1574161 RepID=UPI00301DC83A
RFFLPRPFLLIGRRNAILRRRSLTRRQRTQDQQRGTGMTHRRSSDWKSGRRLILAFAGGKAPCAQDHTCNKSILRFTP